MKVHRPTPYGPRETLADRTFTAPVPPPFIPPFATFGSSKEVEL